MASHTTAESELIQVAAVTAEQGGAFLDTLDHVIDMVAQDTGRFGHLTYNQLQTLASEAHSEGIERHNKRVRLMCLCEVAR